MTMVETIIASLILAFVSALTYLAYKHPLSYPVIALTIGGIITVITLMKVAYGFGYNDGRWSVIRTLPFHEWNTTEKKVPENSQDLTMIVWVASVTYLGVLWVITNST